MHTSAVYTLLWCKHVSAEHKKFSDPAFSSSTEREGFPCREDECFGRRRSVFLWERKLILQARILFFLMEFCIVALTKNWLRIAQNEIKEMVCTVVFLVLQIGYL